MAARENDGLRIAVMVFFLLVVLLAVTTYMFFKQADDAAKRIAQLESDVEMQRTAALASIDEVTEIKKLLGYGVDSKLGTPAAPEPDTILDDFNKDMEAYAGNVETKNYRTVVKDLFEVKTANAETHVSTVKAKDGELDTTKGDLSKEQTRVGHFETVAKDQEAKLTEVKGKFDDDVKTLGETKESLQKQLDDKRTEMTEAVAAVEKTAKELSTAYENLKVRYDRLVRERKVTEGSSAIENPDGQISWVNQRENVVWVNLGQDDNLKRQTIFSVYPQETSEFTEANKKGSIEITRIIDRHMAEGRILQDELSDPIVMGDKIHSPVWERGRVEGFALAGFMDVDGDGKSDRAKIRELIKLNGGNVDAEVADDGKLLGKIESTTRYIVMGDPPTEKSNNQELVDNFSLLTGQAQELAIEKIPAKRFVEQMGWRPDERTVTLGKNASGADFRPRADDKVPSKDTLEKFRRREAPKKSAF